MAALTSILGGLGLAASLGGAVMGARGGGNSSEIANISLAENSLRMQQAQLDAERRKRDVIRQAQVATATVENNAANSGGLNSSAAVGATSAISGQAGVNTLGIEQNLQFAQQLFMLNNARGQALWNNSRSQARSAGINSLAQAFSKSAGGIGKLAEYGWGKLGGLFDNSWDNENDINQVGSNA